MKPKKRKIKMNNNTTNTLKSMHLFNTHLFQNEELELSSNTMIFGTNGVGKTTTLSLLTFFSTGNQRIFKPDTHQSKSFYDFFFEKNNSFIVYEYEKEDHNVLVAVYAKEGVDKLLFQFIALEKDSYIVSDIFNRDTRAEILNRIDSLAISSIIVTSKEYLKILYGDSKKENNIYMFSHVRNYKTYSKLHYSSFRNIAIDSTAIKNIILEYAYAKDGMSRNGVNLERHGEAIENFQSDHSAIMEWKENHHTIDTLRDSLLKVSAYEKRKIDTLLKIKREWTWYVELIQDTEDLIVSKTKEKNLYMSEEYPLKKKKLNDKLELDRKTLNDLEQSAKIIKNKMEEYKTNDKLISMINELPKLSEYESELESSKNILFTLQEKNKSAAEKHEVKLSELKKHYDATVNANNLFFIEQEKVFLSKKLKENTLMKDAENKARKDFSNTDVLKEELTASDRNISEHKLEFEKLKLKKFLEDERGISFQVKIDETKKHLLGFTSKYNSLEQKEKDLSREEETFLEGQRKNKETNRIAIDKVLEEIKQNVLKLDTLSSSTDTLYSQIVNSGLNIQKYTSVLKMEVLESNDFTINKDKNSTGMQIFDFKLAENTTLVEKGETLYEKKKLLKEKKEHIKKLAKKELKALETEYNTFFTKYRSEWTSLKEERATLDSTKKQYTENLDVLNEEKNKADESWQRERKILLDNMSNKINSCGSTSSTLRAEIKKLEEEFKEILEKIQSNPYDEKADIRNSEDTCVKKNKEAEKKYEAEKFSEKTQYKKVLGDSGVSGDEVDKYGNLVKTFTDKIKSINAWEIKIREYESFVETDWIKYDGLKIELSQKYSAFEKLRKDTENQLNDLSARSIEFEENLSKLGDKKSTLTNKNTHLLRQIESYEDLLANISPLPEKTEQEKKETNFKTEADELLSTLASSTKVLNDENGSLTKNIAKDWGTFIAKGVILFSSDPIENARIIVSADDVDEMGVFTDKTYQSINLSINAISGHYSILQDAYSTVKSAISRINKDLEDISSTSLIESIKLRAKDKHSGIDESMRELAEYWKLHSDNMQQNLFATDAHINRHQEAILEKLKDFLSKLSLLSNKERTISVGSLFDLQGKIIEKGNESDWEDGAFGKGSEGTRILIKVAITASLFSMALSGSKDKQIPLLLIDEIGKLHNDNVQRVLEYINKKGSYLVAVQPNNSMAKFFSKAYLLEERSKTQSAIIKYLRRKTPLKMKSA